MTLMRHACLTLSGTWCCAMEAQFAHDGAVMHISPFASRFNPSAFPDTFVVVFFFKRKSFLTMTVFMFAAVDLQRRSDILFPG